MNQYELTLVLGPEEAEAEKTIAKVKGWVEAAKGKVVKADKWGARDLAYPIGKQAKGLFQFFLLSLLPEGVSSLERRLRMEKGIMRHLLVRVDES